LESRREEIPSGNSNPIAAIRVLRSEELFGDARELGILHAGALYRLTMTRQGKLILTK
jgi:hemin uptake protein HemP